MPIVNIQGVGLVNFPDEMSREQINSAIEKEILPKFPEVQAQVPRGFVGGAKDIGASFVSGVGNLMQLPGQISELVGFTRTGDLDYLGRLRCHRQPSFVDCTYLPVLATVPHPYLVLTQVLLP